MGKTRYFDPARGPASFRFVEWWAVPLLNWTGIEIVSEGIENIESEIEKYHTFERSKAHSDGLFLAANHLSFTDHFVIMKEIHDKIVEGRMSPQEILGQVIAAVAKEKYYTFPFFGHVLQWGKQIPVTNTYWEFEKIWKSSSSKVKTKFLKDHLSEEERKAFTGNPRQLFESVYLKALDHDPQKPEESLIRKVQENTRASLIHTAQNTGVCIREGKPILIYPEGTRSTTGKIRPVKTGVTQLIFEYNGRVVPTAIMDTDKLFHKSQHWTHLFKILDDFLVRKRADPISLRVRYGKPISLPEIFEYCRKDFKSKEKHANLHAVDELEEMTRVRIFKAWEEDYDRFQPIFELATTHIMTESNKMLSSEYRADRIEVKYSK
ncbi:MAG: lysophospholipid acyltransferase family protein [archaeon]